MSHHAPFRRLRACAVIAGLTGATLFACSESPEEVPIPVRSPGPALSFVPNVGQRDDRVVMEMQGRDATLLFARNELALSLPSSAGGGRRTTLRLRFEGSNPATQVTGIQPRAGVVNFFLGNDPTRWRSGVPTYGAVVYHDLYPGIELRYDGAAGLLKGTYTVAAGAEVSRIRWRYDGAAGREVDARTGALHVTFADDAGPRVITEQAPVAWQERDGRRVEVPVSYRLDDDGSIGFDVGRHDPDAPLVIDPTVVFSSYLGGGWAEQAHGVAVTAMGNLYLAGDTFSPSFPTGAGLQSAVAGGTDFYVTKLAPDGTSLLYSTYLGGSGNEFGGSIAVNGDGNVYLTGGSTSTDFPVAWAYQPFPGGGHGPFAGDAVVARLSADGTRLVYSTYLGGSEGDAGWAIAVDGAGDAYIGGGTSSPDFPVSEHAFATTAHAGDLLGDAFVTKLGADGRTLEYSTYVGGSGIDEARGIAVDAAGRAYLTGVTGSADFPVVHAAQPLPGGGDCGGHACTDAFVTVLDPDGSSLVRSSYLGGSGNDVAAAIAVAPGTTNAWITGSTASSDFPLRNPLQPARAGGSDAFVTRVDGGGALVFSTYLGGTGDDAGAGIVVDAGRHAHLTGRTASPDFPQVAPVQTAHGDGACSDAVACRDAFAARLDPWGRELLYSTYLGGAGPDEGRAVALAPGGDLLVTGNTSSTHFPVSGARQLDLGGDTDAFMVRLHDGSTAPVDLVADRLEVTQVIQDLDNSISLVDGKRTFARFHVHSSSDGVGSFARLTVTGGAGTAVLTPLGVGGQIVVRPTPDRAQTSDSFLFELPSRFTTGTVTLTAELNPDVMGRGRFPVEADYGNNTVTTTVSFTRVNPLSVTLFDIDRQVATPQMFQIWTWLDKAYPRPLHVNLRDLPGVSHECGWIDVELYAMWQLEHLVDQFSLDRYYGAVDDLGGGAFMRGCSFPGPIASGPSGAPAGYSLAAGWDTDSTYGDWYAGHELAHALGVSHVLGSVPAVSQCGTEPGPVGIQNPGGVISPVPTGNSAVFGFDNQTRSVLGPSWHDMMTYCPQQWIAPSTYRWTTNSALSWLSGTGADQPRTTRLFVNGLIDAGGGSAKFLPMFVLPAAPAFSDPPQGNEGYAITLYDTRGTMLARYPVAPRPLEYGPAHDGPGGGTPPLFLSAQVPYVEGTLHVVVSGPSGALYKVEANLAAPAVKVYGPAAGSTVAAGPVAITWSASDRDRDPLSYYVLHSGDGGGAWRLLGRTTSTSFTADARVLVPGGKTRFRVLATDGIHTTTADSATFTVADRAPAAAIVTTADDLRVIVGQPLSLVARVLDPDTGSLDPQQISWTSDLVGLLGHGAELTVSGLPVGTHTITLRADDGQGGVATAVVQAVVIDE